MTKNNKNELAVIPMEKNLIAPLVGVISEKITSDKYTSESYSDIIKCDNVSDDIKEKTLEMKYAYDKITAENTTCIIITGLICLGIVHILTKK